MKRKADRVFESNVAILGAGPAGAGLSIRLAQMGYGVTLFHSMAKKRQHVGESLPASTRPILEALGFDLEAETKACYEPRPPVHRIFWGDRVTEMSSENRSSQEQSLMVWRGAFDEVLLRLAENAGATLVEASALSVDTGAREGVKVRFALTDGKRSVHETRFVADCTGRSGIIARGVRKRLTSTKTLALTSHWEGAVEKAATLLESFANGWIWSAPVRAGSAERDVTMFLDASDFDPTSNIERVYEQNILTAPNMAEALGESRRVDAVRGIDATPYGAEVYQADRHILLGDAASFLDPLSAHGVHKALDSAFAASVSIRTVLERPKSASIAREFYNRREREIVDVTEERTGHFYWAENRFAAEPFWLARSVQPGPADSVEVPPPKPPLQRAMTLTASPGVRVEERAVLHDDFVERLPVLCKAAPNRPVRYWDGVALPDLFRAASSGVSVEQVARSQVCGFDRAYRAIEWLYDNAYLGHASS